MMFEHLSKLFRSFWQKSHRSPGFLPLLAVLVTVILLLIFKLLQPEPPVKKTEEKSWIVQTQQLVDGAKSPQLELYGRVESPFTATLTAGINADIKSLDIKEGQSVVTGQLLVRLDESDVQLTLRQKVSDVAELEALIQSEKNRHRNDLDALKLEKSLVSLAETKLSREEKTSKANLTSQSSFDSQMQALQNQKLALTVRQLAVTDHPARLAQLEARLAHKRALVQQAETDLQRASVVAPFDGIILSTSVSPGERVRPGEELVKLYSTENVELRAQLPQKYVDIVKQAMAQDITLLAQVKTAQGIVEVALQRISGAITETGIGVDALFEVKSKDAERFIMGEVLEITLTLAPINNVFSVPVSSIYGTNRIYRIEDERLVAINVEKPGIQIKDDKQFVLVRSEKLKPGDEIIIMQLPHAVSGLKVEVRNTASAADGLSQEISPSAEQP